MIKVRPYCQMDHDRELMTYDPIKERYSCSMCMFKVTAEMVHHSVPPQYRFLFNPMFGEIAASMLDIGAIDLIFDNPLMAKIEMPRERHV